MPKFKTIEVSDPQLSLPGLQFVTVQSPALGRRGDLSVYKPGPPFESQDLPIVLLLHGVYNSHWSWLFKAGAHLTAQKLIEKEAICPMGLVMPSDGLFGDGSGYLDHSSGNYEKWVVEDVLATIKTCFPIFTENSPVFICGFSMGGYGALRLGAKFPKRFKGVSAHSAFTAFDQMALFVSDPLSIYQQSSSREGDVFQWILANQKQMPPFRFDCGKEDKKLIEVNRKLNSNLLERKIEHVYEEFEGGHDWEYWKIHLADSLRFFSSILTGQSSTEKKAGN